VTAILHVLSGNPNHLYGAALLQSAIQLKAISSVRPSVVRLFAFENCVKTAKRVVKLLLDRSCYRRATLEDVRIVNRTGATRRICISLYFAKVSGASFPSRRILRHHHHHHQQQQQQQQCDASARFYVDAAATVDH